MSLDNYVVFSLQTEIEELESIIRELECKLLNDTNSESENFRTIISQLSAQAELLKQRIFLNVEQANQQIAEFKRVEGVIERAKQEWEATFDAVTDMVILTDNDRIILRVNSSTTEFLNKTYREIIGRRIDDVLFGGVEGKVHRILVGESREVEFPMLTGCFDIANYPLVMKSVPYGNVYVIKDVTEQKRTQETLRISEEKLRRANDELEARVEDRTLELYKSNQDLQHEIIERETIQAIQAKEKEFLAITLLSINDGVISTEKNGKIVLFNKAAEIVTGLGQSDVLGNHINNILKLVDEKTGQVIEDPLSVLLRFNSTDHSSPCLALINNQGEKRLISANGAKVSDAKGKLMGYVVVFNDITEQQRMGEMLALSQKMDSIGHLAAGIAHEINTPLQYVGDNTHFLDDAYRNIAEMMKLYDEFFASNQNQGNNNEVCKKITATKEELDFDYYVNEAPIAISQSLEGIDRVRKIVLAMKAFSHPGTKEKQAANINQGIEITTTISRNEWKYIADLEMDLDPDLPFVYCSIDEINQVILNMIINATQAIEEANRMKGEEKGKITITTRHQDDHILIMVKDTGIGISAENKSRIFDPFFTTKDVGKGTGQGLSLAHNIIVQLHQGSIQVESEVGKGTTFIIQLPIGESVASDEWLESE